MDEWWREIRAFLDEYGSVGLRLGLVLAGYLLLRWLLGKAVDAVLASVIAQSGVGRESHVARLRTLQSLLRSVLGYLLGFVAVVTALGLLGLDIRAILAGAGVAGLAVGFGAQRLVRDVITGFFILVEDQYSVGDRITVGPTTGVVEDMGMRITRLRDDGGRLVILANGDVSSVVNHSRGPLRCSVDVSLPRETDLAALAEQLAATAPAPGGPLLEAPELAGITALDAGTLTVRVAAAAEPGKQQEAEMLLREKILSATRPKPPRAP